MSKLRYRMSLPLKSHQPVAVRMMTGQATEEFPPLPITFDIDSGMRPRALNSRTISMS